MPMIRGVSIGSILVRFRHVRVCLQAARHRIRNFVAPSILDFTPHPCIWIEHGGEGRPEISVPRGPGSGTGKMEELYHSVKEETSQPIDAEISGTLPAWLAGSLFRNGPALFEIGQDKFTHLFDGMAMVHKFNITPGKVTYQNRFVRSDSYVKNMAAQRIVVSEFGTLAHPDPCKSLYDRFFSYFRFPSGKDSTDNTCVHIYPMGDYMYASTETNYLRRIDPKTLDTVGEKVDISKLVSVNAATAHPHIDPDGTVHNLGSVHEGGFKYAIITMTPPKPGDSSPCEHARIVAEVPSQWRLHPSYFHSFAMTENHYVLVESPMVLNLLKILTSHLRGAPFSTSMEWHGKYPTRFHIIEKKTGRRLHSDFELISDSFITLHHINAYEEDGHVVMDCCAFKEGTVYEAATAADMHTPGLEERLSKGPRPEARRYVLPLKDLATQEKKTNLVKLPYVTATAIRTTEKTVRCTPEVVCDAPFEFPQINYKSFNGTKYRYAYGCGYHRSAIDCIIKADLETKTSLQWREEGSYPSEPVFVPRPGSQEEDEGVLLSVLLTTGPDRYAYLLVLNAKDLSEVARATVPVKIARDFHGTFVEQF